MRGAWRALLAKTLIIFGRNTPVFCALAVGVRPGAWPLGQRALLVSGGAILSAWLISATERFVDPDRVGFAWKDFVLNAMVFALSGSLICWYIPLGSYGSDGAVGVALTAVIVGVQYGVLGAAFFFDRLRAALAYFGALAVIAPLFLNDSRSSCGVGQSHSSALSYELTHAAVLTYASCWARQCCVLCSLGSTSR